MMTRYLLCIWFVGSIALTAAGQHSDGAVEFECNDASLQQGFQWARAQALSWVRRGHDPVGHWYEASLPGRSAFCMRDVSHQLSGANLLGLADINKNLLFRFAASVDSSRDWCGYWEIDKEGGPAPVDYKSDLDFWFNLPGNFDVMNACVRQYQWSSDTTYLQHPVFQRFYEVVSSDYIKRWDRNGDGIMEGTTDTKIPYRGIGSYEEAKEGLTGCDLIAIQSHALSSLGNLLRDRGDRGRAAALQQQADKLFHRFQNEWWNDSGKFYYQFLQKDSNRLRNDPMQVMLLRWNFVASSRIKDVLRSVLESESQMNVETLSYLPRELFRYGSPAEGVRALKKLTSPELKRREYPEVSFAALEAYCEGLMGIGVHAPDYAVSTLSRLPSDTLRARLLHIPLFGGTIDVAHEGQNSTTISNHTPQTITWFAGFHGEGAWLQVAAMRERATATLDLNGRKVLLVRVKVAPGATVTAKMP
ncbi:MAG: hypothetical protein K1X47_06340 [Cyclobacteriaceae bacterium]|nr:hypothetical protein [Cyclobacteriaceae bacterium]